MDTSNAIEITFTFARAFAHCTSGRQRISSRLCSQQDLKTALSILDNDYPGIKANLFDNHGAITDSVNIYVNGDNVRYLGGLNTVLKHGDVINIIPAAAAG